MKIIISAELTKGLGSFKKQSLKVIVTKRSALMLN